MSVERSENRGRDIAELIAEISVEQLRADLTVKDYRWYFIDAAVAAIQDEQTINAIRQSWQHTGNDPAALKGLASQIIEGFMARFTPGNWKEPIKVSGFVDQRVADDVAEVIAKTLRKE